MKYKIICVLVVSGIERMRGTVILEENSTDVFGEIYNEVQNSSASRFPSGTKQIGDKAYFNWQLIRALQ